MHPLLPLLILFSVLLAFALVAYVAYTVATDIASKTSRKMEERNVVFSKDGMRVGVKEVRQEGYVDGSRSVLVKAWNYSSWPAYKSRFWNKEGGVVVERPQAHTRVPYTRTTSGKNVRA